MNQKINLYLQLKTRHYRDSLAALLVTLPEVGIFVGENIFRERHEPDDKNTVTILLYESAPRNDENFTTIWRMRQAWPKLKIILLVEAAYPLPNSVLKDVDLILPVNATAGELLQSINRLGGRDSHRHDLCQFSPMIVSHQ